MSPRQYLAGAAGLVAVAASLLLMAPAWTNTSDPPGQELLCGTPLQPALADAETADQISDGRTDYRNECTRQLAARRLWAIPTAAIAALIAICSYRRGPPKGSQPRRAARDPI